MYVFTMHLPYSDACAAQVVVDAIARRRKGVVAAEDGGVDMVGRDGKSRSCLSHLHLDSDHVMYYLDSEVGLWNTGAEPEAREHEQSIVDNMGFEPPG